VELHNSSPTTVMLTTYHENMARDLEEVMKERHYPAKTPYTWLKPAKVFKPQQSEFINQTQHGAYFWKDRKTMQQIEFKGTFFR
jgi:hypothetical protein